MFARCVADSQSSMAFRHTPPTAVSCAVTVKWRGVTIFCYRRQLAYDTGPDSSTEENRLLIEAGWSRLGHPLPTQSHLTACYASCHCVTQRVISAEGITGHHILFVTTPRCLLSDSSITQPDPPCQTSTTPAWPLWGEGTSPDERLNPCL